MYMQCIAYPTCIYIYIPLICHLHTIYKLKIYINHIRFYVIVHNYLPLTLMWPRQKHTHIYIYIYIYTYIYIYIYTVYICIDNGYSYLHIFHLNHLSIRKCIIGVLFQSYFQVNVEYSNYLIIVRLFTIYLSPLDVQNYRSKLKLLFFSVSPKTRFCFLLFVALSCSSPFCHEVFGWLPRRLH